VAEKHLGYIDSIEIKYSIYKTGLDNYKLDFFADDSLKKVFATAYLDDASCSNLEFEMNIESQVLKILSNYPLVSNNSYELGDLEVVFSHGNIHSKEKMNRIHNSNWVLDSVNWDRPLLNVMGVKAEKRFVNRLYLLFTKDSISFYLRDSLMRCKKFKNFSDHITIYDLDYVEDIDFEIQNDKLLLFEREGRTKSIMLFCPKEVSSKPE
jgi:hypothetical protein